MLPARVRLSHYFDPCNPFTFPYGPGAECDGGPTRKAPATAARLDRLPIGLFHKRMTWALGYVFFFELGDIYTFSYAAPALLMSKVPRAQRCSGSTKTSTISPGSSPRTSNS